MASSFPKSANLNFNKNLVKRHKLVTHLDMFLANEPEDFEFKYEPKKDDDAWHPSGSCTPPVSALYAGAKAYIDAVNDPDVTIVKKQHPASLQKTFLVGHFWHQLLQHAVVKMGFAESSAIEAIGVTGWGNKRRVYQGGSGDGFDLFRPYHWATGQADVAPLVLPTGEEYLVDFKTMGSHDYKRTGMPSWAAEKYEAQINIYMDWFDMDQALIVAVQKDSPHEMKEFEFERNQPLVDAIYEKWHFVSECLDSGNPVTKLDDDDFKLDGLFKGPVAQ